MNDPNVFVFSAWRQNNVVNIIHLWFTFLTTYYLYSSILEVGFKKFVVDSSKKLIGLLIITQLIAFVWVVITDILFYKVYYDTTSLNDTTFYEFDVPLAIVLLTIGSVYFYQKNYLTPINPKPVDNTDQKPSNKSLEVFKGSSSIFISPDDIGIIHLSNKMVWVTSMNNETYQTNFSLTELSSLLSTSNFFRLNRQVIISRKIIKGYDRIEYQKLEVLVGDDMPSGLNYIVSKYNAPGFKNWLTNSI